MNYTIHNSRTGEQIATLTDFDDARMDNLSSNSPEGHFRAGECDELVSLGIDPDQSVYAIVA